MLSGETSSWSGTRLGALSRCLPIAAGLVLGVGCPAALEPDRVRPDILLVSIDTLRADHTSAHGYRRRTTPSLERLAAEGARFALAYAPTATTAPSHATLLTGVPPLAHGVDRNGVPLGAQPTTLPEVLRSRGYATGAFVSSFVVNHAFGFARGFDVYDDDFTDPARAGRPTRAWQGQPIPGGAFRRSADSTTDRALRWIDERGRGGAQPMFAFVHYIDPHEPYDPPATMGDPFDARILEPGSIEWIVARYDTLVLFTDEHLGRLIDGFEAASGRAGALVLVTADHGEGFLEHGWRSHGVQIYEEALRVPLVIRWRGRVAPGRVVDVPVALEDVPPTLLGLAGVPKAPAMHGRDLASLVRGESPALERPVFFERQSYEREGLVEPIPLRTLNGLTFGSGVAVAGRKSGVRSGRWKYLEAPEEPVARELYDLVQDPGETRNLAAAHPAEVERLSALIGRWRASARGPRPAAPSREDAARLEELGYLAPVETRTPPSVPPPGSRE